MTYLRINPLIKAWHYQFYFNISYCTAKKMLIVDKITLDKKMITYLDFFKLYEAFPDPQFKPVWAVIEISKANIAANLN